MPSVAMNPFFEELAASNPDVLFLLVDVDEVKVISLISQTKQNISIHVCIVFDGVLKALKKTS